MKKITFILLGLLFCLQINGQELAESFDGTTFPPPGWTNTQVAGTGTTSVWNRVTAGTYPTAATQSGAGMAQFNSFNYAAGTAANLITPAVDLSAPANFRVTFWMYRDNGYLANAEKIDVYINTVQNQTGSTLLGTINRSINLAPVVASNGWYKYSFSIPSSFNSTDNYFIFRATSAYGNNIFLDDVVVEEIPAVAPTCVVVTSPANNAVNVSNTTVNWASNIDATGYRISVGTSSGATDILNNFDVGNVLSYFLSGLEGGTTYFVTVYPYNANGQATGCTESNFTTCDEFGDFSENFDGLGALNLIPGCWSRVLSNGVSSFATVGTSGTNYSAPYSISLYNSDSPATANIMLVTPFLNNLDAGTNRLRFFARNSTATQDIQVGTMSNPSDASTFTVLQTVDINTTFGEYSVSFAAYSGTDKYIAIRRLSTSTYTYVYLDNIVWEAIPAVAPTCVAITSPTSGAVNVMNSNVTWASNADATGYYMSVGTSSGGTDVLNLFDVGNVLSYSFPTDAGSTYFVTVFPYNSFGQATGCTEINFTTCDALSVPHLETFSTFLPSCWQAADNGNLTTGPATFGTSSWAADGFGNIGGTGAIKINIDFTGDNDWVISPVVNIPATGYELKFDAAVTQWNGTGAPTTPWEADDFVEVLVSTTGLNNWTVLYTYNNTNVPAPTGSSNVINLDSYAGLDVRFAFRGVEGAADGGADVDFFIDNFEIRLTPATAPSCATNVVATPNATCGNFANNITWDAVAGADGYNITIGTTTGGNDVANNVNLGNVLSYSFSGNANTMYYFTIFPYNGVGPATGCSEVSFTTSLNGCFCVPTYTNGGGGDNITNVAIGAWSNASTGNVNPYYEDFTTQQPAPIAIPTLTAGLASTVSVTMGTDGTQFSRVWIDFNQNLTFEPSESFSLGTNAGGSGTANIIVNVPAGATLGVTRMRIRGGDDAAILNTQACGASSSTYGQTEDYLVNILAAPACLPPTGLTATAVTASTANLGWTEAGTATSWDVEWGTFGFTPTGTPTITNATNPQGISSLSPNTTYSFYVRANCGAGGYSTWSGPFSFTTSCVADNIPYTQNFESATVPNLPSCTTQQNVGTGNLWTVQNNPGYGFTTKALRYAWNGSSAANVWFYTNGINLVGGTTYKISYDYGGTGTTFPEKLRVSYGNSASAAAMTTLLADHPNVTSATPVNNFVDFTPATSGVYYFGFNAYSIADQFYLFVDNIVVDLALSNSDFDNSNFLAYPNPVRDILNISYTSEISSVRVVNMLGQEVISRAINATSTQVDMSHLSAGTYIVNVTVGDSTKTLKVVKQ